uniref:Uncharacterized protein n=1 Tax=viral metagenome TaxID=1070528 RepID=A0A6C0D7I8_9ZZZZ
MEVHKQVLVSNDNTSVRSSSSVKTEAASLSPEEQLRAQQELTQLSNIIKEWKEVSEQVRTLNEQVREKRKRLKVQEEMILRIMKKHNIGALDLKGSGGRILYRRSTSKGGMNEKLLFGLLSQHLKSETAAADAVKFITEHREAKMKESLMYEKE